MCRLCSSIWQASPATGRASGKESMMPIRALYGVSIVLSFIAWGIVTARYFWPALRDLPRACALRPILVLHGFRFIGLALLVPGVVSPLRFGPIVEAPRGEAVEVGHGPSDLQRVTGPSYADRYASSKVPAIHFRGIIQGGPHAAKCPHVFIYTSEGRRPG